LIAQEALRADGVRQLRMQHLDRHEPLVALVAREVYRRRAPPADLALQRVASAAEVSSQDELPRKNVVQGGRCVFHGWLRLGGER
jgi:hypothetical protein